MFFETGVDQGFRGVFTDARSGERTPTGAVRMGLRPTPHRSRGTAESEHGQCSPATSNRANERLRAVGRNGESATVTGNRSGSRVTPGRWSPSGGGRRRRPAEALGRRRQLRRAGVAARQPGLRETAGDGAVVGADGSGATPTGLGRGRFHWHQDRWLGQPGQRESVTTGSRPGNRCRT